MLLARYVDSKGRPGFGRVEGDSILPQLGDMFGSHIDNGDPICLDETRLLAPVMPSKVVGIGSNYKKHIEEMGRSLPKVPKVFLKPNTSVIGPGAPIVLPPGAERVDHEAELAVVMGRRASCVGVDEAMSYVLGITCLNDVTCRDFQRADGVFTRGKGFDSFCPIGPWILKTQENITRTVKCSVDGVLRQHAETSDLIFDVPTLIAFVSNIMTLLPGDIIATGTPSGVSPLSEGQLVSIFVEGVGELNNPVVHRQDRV